jgi:hypothetical protein
MEAVMLVGELRTFDKPDNVLEAEHLGRVLHDRAISGVDGRRTEMPVASWLDRVASLGLTIVLTVVLFLCVTALVQADAATMAARAPGSQASSF